MEFGERLKAIRQKKNIKQAELANISGVSLRTLSRYETGEVSPSIKAIQKLAGALEISTEELTSDNFAKTQNANDLDVHMDTVSEARDDLMKHAQAVSAILAGGKIPDEDRAAVMKIIIEALTKTPER